MIWGEVYLLDENSLYFDAWVIALDIHRLLNAVHSDTQNRVMVQF